jgi:hypothetical protein
MDGKMTKPFRRAVVLSAALAVASCSGTADQGGSPDQVGYESGGFDTNWVWAGLSLALLFAISRN